MKIKNFMCIASAAITAICAVSCTGCSTGQTTEEKDNVPADSIIKDNVDGTKEIVARIGDGTTMNYLELVTATDDTLSVRYVSNNIQGHLLEGESISVTYKTASGENELITAVNLSSLQHLWENKEERSQNIEFGENGMVTTYNMPTEYDHWSVEGGRVLLHRVRPIGQEARDVTDTLTIQFGQDAEGNDVVLTLDDQVFELRN